MGIESLNIYVCIFILTARSRAKIRMHRTLTPSRPLPVTSATAVGVGILVGLLLGGLMFAGGSAVVSASNLTEDEITGDATLDVDVPEPRLDVGETGTLSVFVTNDGEVTSGGSHPSEVRAAVMEARSTSVSITDVEDDAIEVETDEVFAGTIGDGEAAGPLDFTVEVGDDVETGTYEIDIEVEYREATAIEYTRDDEGNIVELEETVRDRTTEQTVDIEIEDDPRFKITDLDHDVQLDDTGSVFVEFENTGEQDVTDARITGNLGDPELFFGSGTTSSEAAVDEWEAGESITIEYRVGTTEDALERAYGLSFLIDFEDESGFAGQHETLTSFTPGPNQSFSVVEMTDTSQIGEEGTLQLVLENDGPRNYSQASVSVSAAEESITLGTQGPSSEAFVGAWERNDTTVVTFRTDVSDEAIEKNYSIDVTVSGEDMNENELTERTRQVGLHPTSAQHFTVEEIVDTSQIGEAGTFEVTIRNEGPRNYTVASLTASSVDEAVGFGSEGPTSEAFVGDVAANDTATITFRSFVDSDAVGGSAYPVELDLAGEDADGNSFTERTRTVDLRPDPEQSFQVKAINHSVRVGDDGVLLVDLRNDGPRTYVDASVSLSAPEDVIGFGTGGQEEPIVTEGVTLETETPGGLSSEGYVERWEAGETVTLAYRASVGEDALPKEYTVVVAVDGEDPDGNDLNEHTRAVGFEPLPEQEFAVRAIESSLRVGDDGTLIGELENTGDEPVDNVVTLLESEFENIYPRESQYAHGTLEPGETSEFELRIGVSEDAEPGSRQFEISTRYRNPDGDVRASDSHDLLVDIGERVDEFAIEVVDTNIAPGSERLVELEIENTYGERLTDIRVKLFTSSPLESGDDEAFIPVLAYGENETVGFEVTSDSEATPRTYPMSLDFRYEDERGDSTVSDTYRVPVTVTDTEERALPTWVILGSLLVLVGVGWHFRAPIDARLGTVKERLDTRDEI